MPKMTKVTKMPKIKVFYPFKMIEFRIVHLSSAGLRTRHLIACGSGLQPLLKSIEFIYSMFDLPQADKLLARLWRVERSMFISFFIDQTGRFFGRRLG
jgi:hypothetical protein